MSLDPQQQQLLLERLDQMVQLQQQSNLHFEDLRRTHEEFQKRSAATIEALERRVRILEEHPRDMSRIPTTQLDIPSQSSQSNHGTHVETATPKEKHRNKVLTAEQTKFKRSLCLEYKEFTGVLPPLEVRKSLAKKLYDQYREDPSGSLTMEVCEQQINNWFYDQMRNKARGTSAVATGEGGAVVGEKKRAGRKRKTEGQGWAPAPAAAREKADTTEHGGGSSEDIEARSHFPPLHHKEHVHLPHSHHHHHHHHGHHQHHSHVHDEHPFDTDLSEFPE